MTSAIDLQRQRLAAACGTDGVVAPLCEPPRYHVGCDVVEVSRGALAIPHYRGDYVVRPRTGAMASAFYCSVELANDGQFVRLAGEWDGSKWELFRGDDAIPVGRRLARAVRRAQQRAEGAQ